MLDQISLDLESTGTEPIHEEFDPFRFYVDVLTCLQLHYQNPLFASIGVACSFGKDSTLVTVLAIEALRRMKLDGLPLKPLVVMTSNTRIENPLVERMVKGEMDKILTYAKSLDLPVHTITGKPNVSMSWACKVIAGQSLAPISGSSNSWCSVDFKINPLIRAQKQWEKDNGINGAMLKLTGMRFSESQSRGKKMSLRNDSPVNVTQNKAGEYLLSPIANLTADDVWTMLAFLRSGDLAGSYSEDFGEELFEVYQQAGGTSCVVVADINLSQYERGECSARTGCWACTVAGQCDASLENMLKDHSELKPLYDIRQWVYAITFDFSKRNWVGRTIKDGFITIAPDSYAPEVTRDLLRYCLSADMDEQARAKAAGEDPLYRIIDLETLLSIDFYWAIYGQQRCFEAWRIYRDVVENGSRYYPPELEPAERTTPPAPRFLYVGDGWMDGENDGCTYRYAGLRDVLMEHLEADTGSDLPLKTLSDGREILDYEAGQSMTVDLENDDTWDFLEFMLDYEMEQAERLNLTPSTAARVYLNYGVVKYPNLSKLDAMLRRASFREHNNLNCVADISEIMPLTVSFAEKQRLTKSHSEKGSLNEQYSL